MLCRSFFVLVFWLGLAACAPAPRSAPAGPDDEPTGGMLTPEEEAAFAAHVRVLSKEELAAEQNEKVFRFTKYLVDNATPGCQEELNDVFALTNSTEDRAIPPDSLFSEECDEEFAFVRGSTAWQLLFSWRVSFHSLCATLSHAHSANAPWAPSTHLHACTHS